MQRSLDRKEELERWRWRYLGRGKEGKGRLLDEFCQQYEFERKYAIKVLSGSAVVSGDSAPRPGPEPKYEPVAEVLTTIWRAAEQLCGKRLVRALPLWLPFYERHYGKAAADAKETPEGSQRGDAGPNPGRVRHEPGRGPLHDFVRRSVVGCR